VSGVLVVARWNEDLDWTADVPSAWRVAVVQKDIQPGDGDMLNMGREPGSFLWWIDTHYDVVESEALYGFVQGDPFPHCPLLFQALDLAAEHGVERFQPLTGDRSHPLEVFSDGTGLPHHAALPVAEWYELLLSRPFPGEVGFWAGGQFVVTGKALLDRPRDWYASLLADAMCVESLPWVLERLWPSIFGGEA
jgi:hypothetical protein